MDLPANVEKSTTLKRLIDEVIAGEFRRNKFEAWEVDILLDMLSCDLPAGGPVTRLRVLRQYQETACQKLDEGSDDPMKLSQYLESLKSGHRRTLTVHQHSRERNTSRSIQRKRYSS